MLGAQKTLIGAALDRKLFREREQKSQSLPLNYKRIAFSQVTSQEHLIKLYEEFGKRIFVKLIAEGNSRGCLTITSKTELFSAWDYVQPYLKQGILVEELINNAQEYSWDHVAGCSWITEKTTTVGKYRAEIQQVVPAYIDRERERVLLESGKFMAELCGYAGTACHNEMFYLIENHKVVAVEPNLRPAGMRIWDLAALAFDDFEPWTLWIEFLAGKQVKSPKLKRTHYAAIRMITALHNGVLAQLPDLDLKAFLNDTVEIIELKWTKNIGDKVTSDVKDNADFLGFIIARSKNYNSLISELQNLCSVLERKVEIVKCVN